MNSQTFGEKIRALRQAKGLSLAELSRQISYNASSLSKIERNQMVASEQLIEPLAKKLEISYEELQIKYLSEKLYYTVKTKYRAKEALEVALKRIEKEGLGTTKIKSKTEILENIKQYFQSKAPIKKAWIFGSFAKNTSISYDSDIDILVTYQSKNIHLMDIIGFKHDLEDITGRSIDLVEAKSLKEKFRAKVDNEKILIYDQQTERSRTNRTYA